MAGLTGTRTLLVLTGLASVTLLAAGGRTWVTGAVQDAVLQESFVSVSGNEAARGVVAAALVALAALLASLTGGRITRWIGASALLLSGALALVMSVRVALDPDGVVGRQAASLTGRTGSIEAHGSVQSWTWLAVGASAVLLLTGLLAMLGVRRRSGLSARYEAPTAGAPATSVAADRAAATGSDWDRLDRGEDPTLDRPSE